MDDSAPAIEFHAFSLAAGTKPLIERLNHTIRQGDLCVISGHSGSGKTTLLRAVLGMMPSASGDIAVFGTLLDEQSVWTLRQRTAYVPQEPDMREGTAREVLKRPFEYRAAKHIRWDEGRVREVLESLHLNDSLLDEDIKQLSGGERQRMAIAAALLLERDLLVLDEPTSALDSRSRDAVSHILRERGRVTVIAASHDVRLLDAADSVIKIGEGD